MFKLALLAGCFIATGSILYSITTSFAFHPTARQLAGAMLFTTGLFLVIFRKAQLFTGNNLMFLSLFKKQSSIRLILRNWIIVYLGNFIGSILIVSLFYFIFSRFEIIQTRLIAIAELKTSYDFMTAFTKAIFCNILVCLAVFLGVTGPNLKAKILGIFIPITLFVYLDFEHSIANMFFIPMGLSLGGASLQESIPLFLGNIAPVTLGNIVGGLILSLVIARLKN